MDYLPLYLRREPARDGTPGKYDVVAYGEVNGKPDLSQPKGRWTWDVTKPTKAYKRVMLNCYQWSVKWLDHMGNPV